MGILQMQSTILWSKPQKMVREHQFPVNYDRSGIYGLGTLCAEGTFEAVPFSNDQSIDFLILGLALYALIKCKNPSIVDSMIVFALVGEDGIVKKTSKCDQCRKDISA
jgi:hypothetical protein